MTLTSDQQWLAYLTRPTRFLLVEDETGIRSTFKQFASLFNCIVDEADRGEEGIRLFSEHLQKDPYHGVFLDMKLPDISGVDVFRKIKSMTPNIPVVVVSGYVTDAMLDEIHQIGFASFVRKPQDFNINFFIQLFSMLGVKKLENMPSSSQSPEGTEPSI